MSVVLFSALSLALSGAPLSRADVAPILTQGAEVITSTADPSTPDLELESGSAAGYTFSEEPGNSWGYRLLSQPQAVHLAVGQAWISGSTLWLRQESSPEEFRWVATDVGTDESWTMTSQSYAISDGSAWTAHGVLPHALIGLTPSNYDHPITANLDDVSVHRRDGSVLSLAVGQGVQPGPMAGDDDGLAMAWVDQSGGRHVSWFDLRLPAGHDATVQGTELPAPGNRGAAGGPPAVAVSQSWISYAGADGSLERISRSDLTQSTRSPLAGAVQNVAITDAGSATILAGTPPHRLVSCSEPLHTCGTFAVSAPDGVQSSGFDGAGTAALIDDSYNNNVVAIGDRFATVTGTSSADKAVVAFTPGASTGTVLDRVGSAQPRAIALAPGRLLVNVGTRAYEQVVTSTGVGAVTPLPSNAGGLVTATSGAHTATVVAVPSTATTPAGLDVVVSRGRTEVARWLLPGTSGLASYTGRLSFSGNRILVPVKGRSLLFDLASPTAVPVSEPTTATLSAGRLAWRSDSGVMLRDLTGRRSHDTVLSPVADDSETRVSDVQLAGDWAFWSTTSYHGSLYDVTEVSRVVHLTASDTIDREIDLPTSLWDDPRDVVLRAGFVAYVTGDRTVHLRDLTSGTDVALGPVAPTPTAYDGNVLAASDDSVAWVAPDNRIHIRSVALPSATGPELLSLSAVAHDRALRVNADLTRAATSWTLVVRNERHRVVARRTGAARQGTISATWRGSCRSCAWTLTGNGRGKGIVTRAGRAAVMKGRLP